MRPLHFDMDKDPEFAARAFTLDFDELIRDAPPHLSIADDLLQFFIQKLVAEFPGDVSGNFREKEGHEFQKIAFNHLFPGAIVISLLLHGDTSSLITLRHDAMNFYAHPVLPTSSSASLRSADEDVGGTQSLNNQCAHLLPLIVEMFCPHCGRMNDDARGCRQQSVPLAAWRIPPVRPSERISRISPYRLPAAAG